MPRFGLAASQASAADLPRKAPAYVPPAPPPVTWTGCYIGANVGGIFTNGDATFAGVEVSRDNSGFAGGGQIGCDYQFSGGWVIGFRNMFDGTSVNRSRQFFAPAFGVTGTVNGDLNWFDALTGRLGYSFTPGWLLYGQGGAAWVKTSTDVAIAGLTFGGTGNTRTGWTAGGGVEWMFAPIGRRSLKATTWTWATIIISHSAPVSARLGVPSTRTRQRLRSWLA